MSNSKSNSNVNDPRLLEVHTAGSFLFLEDAFDIKRAKFFTGKASVDGSATAQHWFEYDDMRLVAEYLVDPSLLEGQPYWHNTGSTKSMTSRIFKLYNDMDDVVVLIGEGPGVPGQAGVVPDKSRRSDWTWVSTRLDRDDRLKLGFFVRDWLMSLLNVRSFMYYTPKEN